MSTLNFHDEKSGRWFRYDSKCAACYLNHEHSHEKHVAYLASARASEQAQRTQEWADANWSNRQEMITRLTRPLLDIVQRETPLLNGAWD